MKARRRFGWFLAALLMVAVSAGSVLAQDQENAPPQQYPNAGDNAPGSAATLPGRTRKILPDAWPVCSTCRVRFRCSPAASTTGSQPA